MPLTINILPFPVRCRHIAAILATPPPLHAAACNNTFTHLIKLRRNITVLSEDLIFLEQFGVYSKIQRKVLRFLICPLPPHTHSLLCYEHPLQRGTCPHISHSPTVHGLLSVLYVEFGQTYNTQASMAIAPHRAVSLPRRSRASPVPPSTPPMIS